MSDEIEQKPVDNPQPSKELATDELSKVTAGFIFLFYTESSASANYGGNEGYGGSTVIRHPSLPQVSWQGILAGTPFILWGA